LVEFLVRLVSGAPGTPPCGVVAPVRPHPARRLAPLLISHLEGNLRLVLDLGDTFFHKAGRKVNAARNFRCPIRPRGQRTPFAHGLTLVVLTLRVKPPWGGVPIGLPVVRWHDESPDSGYESR